ncbi:hypothetical protein GCM10010252_31110 [Streptomyces aureoverticillatus]|nr:hypothetical protein GCM10010252_31110 [Streptomyces aureoverticillatus]
MASADADFADRVTSSLVEPSTAARSFGGCSITAWTLVPVSPNELSPARRTPEDGTHGAADVST